CNNGDIRLGHKESEGLGGTWRVDDYIYLVFQDAYVYEPEDATTFSWIITSLTWNQVTFKNGDYTFTFTKINDER
ncbi:hypothetical protein, partial [Treponema sp.]|uniref:hypothetical protein n=1 Tax=Treponema sp. TaxID=166 RepID=UPI00298E72A6